MIKVVGQQEIDGVMYYAVLDEEDESVEVVPAEIIKRVSSMGMTMGGVTVKDADGNFEVTDEFFFKQEDYEYNDSDFESSEEESDEEYEDEWGYEEDEADETAEEASDTTDDDYTPLDTDEYDDEDDEYVEEDEYFEDEWITEEEENMSEIDKLYAMLTPEQGSLLKRYYLWTSQIMFDTSAGSGVARLKLKNTPKALKKQQEINALRGTGKAWVYAGYLDVGEDHCSLCGARLRYLHFIRDESDAEVDDIFWGSSYEDIDFDKINKAISNGSLFTFGIECTSDFFDISPEELDAIKKNQADATNEMKVMYKMMTSPKSYENAQKSLHIFEMMMDRISKSVARSKLFKAANKFETPLISFYTQFKNSGMLYPRSLVLRLWSTFMGYQYPQRYTRPLSMSVSVKKDMIECYIEKARRSLSDEDRQLVRDLMADDSTYRSILINNLGKYTDNLLLVQFQGIYCYNPYIQKSVDGVFDSPRNRDLGGSNSASKSYYERITGVVERSYGESISTKVPDFYEGYPQCLNMPRVDNIWAAGTSFFTFYPDEVLKMLILAYLKTKVCCIGNSYSISDSVSRRVSVKELKSNKTPEGLVVWDYSTDDTDTVSTYDIRKVVSIAVKSMPAEFNLDVVVESVDREFTLDTAKGLSYKTTVADIDEAIAMLKRAQGISDKREAFLTQAVYKHYEDKKNELNAREKQVFEERKAAAEAKAKQDAEAEARRAEVEERMKEMQAESSTQPDNGVVTTGVDFSGVSADSASRFSALLSKVRDNGFKSLTFADKSDDNILAVFDVIEANPILVDLCNSKNELYLKIIKTVRHYGRISPNQRFRLSEAMELVFETVNSVSQGSTDVVATETVEEVSVVQQPTSNSQITTEVATEEAPAIKDDEQVSTDVEQSDTQQPTSGVSDAVSPVRSDVVDVKDDAEFRAMFNELASSAQKLKSVMSPRDMMNLSSVMRKVKMTGKVTPKQREAVEAAYSLLK